MQFSSITVSTKEPVPSTFTAFNSFEGNAEFIKCAIVTLEKLKFGKAVMDYFE